MRLAHLPFNPVLLPLLSAFASPTVAGPDSRVVESRIERVTVYAQTAHVTRAARVDLPAGIHALVFEKLPLETHTDALGCSVEGDARVLGIRIERRVYAEPVEERVAALRREAAQVGRMIEDLDAELRVLQQKQEFLTGVRVETPKAIAEVASKSGVSSIAHLRLALGFVESEWTVLERRRLEIGRRQSELNIRHGRIDDEIRTLQTPSPEADTRLEAHVDVEVLTAGTIKLELAYLVAGASWRPYYDAGLDRAASEVLWSSYAEIRQTAGEDWEDVELAVSTSDPLRSTSAPDLDPIYLTAGAAPPPPPGTTTTLARTEQLRGVEATSNLIQKERSDNHRAFSAKDLGQLTADNVKEGIALKEGVVAEGAEVHFRSGRSGEVAEYVDGKPGGDGSIISAGYEAKHGNAPSGTISLAEIGQTATATLYRIERRESVPADGSWHRVTVAAHRLPVDLEVLVVPRKASRAYLSARGTNRTDAALLPGLVHLFSGGDYLGTGTLSLPVPPGAPITLSFGSLDRLEVKHQLVSEVRSRSRGDHLLRYHYRTQVANFDGVSRRVVILDQVPVPVDTRIEVEIDRITPNPVDGDADPGGVLRWEDELAPGATETVDLEYEVRFPKEWQIAGF